MRRMPWTIFLWPGLPEVWSHRSWRGLGAALVAAVALDAVLLATCGWSELVSKDWRITLWVVLASAWTAGVVWSIGAYRRQAATEGSEKNGDPFGNAIDHYLRGDYYQTEQILDNLLRRNARDLEARLMRASVLRRTGRLEEALGELDTLTRFEGAEKWEIEIQDERERVAAAKDLRATAA